MTIPKVCLLILVLQWTEVYGAPFFKGLSFHKGFEINLKPLPRKPLTVIKEKWSPFGVFGKKISIHKRSLDDIMPLNPFPRPAAPVFEHIEEIETKGTGPFVSPKPVNMPIVPLVPAPPPVVTAIKPPASVVGKEPPPKPVETSLPAPVIKELPHLPEKFNVFPHYSTNMVIIHPANSAGSHPLTSRALYTDISKATKIENKHVEAVEPIPPPQDKPLDKAVVVPPKPPVPIEAALPIEPIALPPLVPPPKPILVAIPPAPVAPAPLPPVVLIEPVPVPPVPVPIKKPESEKVEPSLPPTLNSEVIEDKRTEFRLKDSSIVRGSKMALQFGTVFLSLMAQFMDSARATIDLMTNPLPKFKE